MGGEDLNNTFKALSDKTRREILNLLKERDMTAGEIANNFSISKPSISHHLSILKQANLIIDIREGQNIIYSINTTVLSDVLGWFVDFMNKEEKGEK